MKKIIILSTLLIISKANFAQQFSFNKLIEMTSSLKTFEIQMIKTLNHMVEKTTVISYSYRTEAGGLGSSRKLPTNNSKYEPKYKFEDGLIYSQSEIEQFVTSKVTFKALFDGAKLHPNVSLITGMICGYRIEEIENPHTKNVRYLDKLVDELAKGKKMEKVLR